MKKLIFTLGFAAIISFAAQAKDHDKAPGNHHPWVKHQDERVVVKRDAPDERRFIRYDYRDRYDRGRFERDRRAERCGRDAHRFDRRYDRFDHHDHR